MTSGLPPYSRTRCALVVLGAALRPDGTPSPALQRRVAEGVRLLDAGAGDVLVLSGGAVGHPRPEAEVMARLARDAGVPEDRMLLEPVSRTTRENARQTRALLTAWGIGRAVVVTDLYHLPRALMVFRIVTRGAGIKITGRAVPVGSMGWAWWAAALREAAAFCADLVRAWRA